jgi:hypothetical protein
VATATEPPDDVICPDDWLYFDNPRLRYGFCYPKDWGFVDFDSGNLDTSLSYAELHGVSIWGPEAFPYPTGVRDVSELPSEEAARIGNAVRVVVSWLIPGTLRIDGCQPAERAVEGPPGTVFCEETYDVLPGPEVQFSDQGKAHALKVLIPIGMIAPGERDNRARLYIKVVSPTDQYRDQPDAEWEIVRTVHLSGGQAR